MVGDLLRHFQLATVLQIRRDAGRTEGMIANPRFDPGRFRPPADDAVDVLLKEGIGGKLASLAPGGAEEIAVDVIRDAGRFDIIVQTLIKTMMTGNVGGQLIRVQSPLVTCMDAPSRLNCTHVFRQLKNPYYLGDEVGLTQTLGWVGAWTSRPSTYAVAARTTQGVVAAVNFARENNLRIVVKGGGHSYQGASNSVDSLLIWTRRLNAVTLRDAFICAGCADEPQQAVTVEAGATWGQVSP